MLQVKVTTPGEMPREFDKTLDPLPVLGLLKDEDPETCVFIGTQESHIVYKLYDDGNQPSEGFQPVL